jgi:cytochrome P450
VFSPAELTHNAEVPTFLVAGHETTSTLVTWALFALALAPTAQTKLRTELRAHPLDARVMDGLPYLDAVVREVLRLHAPVSSTHRIATEDDVIPLAEPMRDRRGRLISEIRVAKGDFISIPIRILNRSVEIWGEDADEFR